MHRAFDGGLGSRRDAADRRCGSYYESRGGDWSERCGGDGGGGGSGTLSATWPRPDSALGVEVNPAAARRRCAYAASPAVEGSRSIAESGRAESGYKVAVSESAFVVVEVSVDAEDSAADLFWSAATGTGSRLQFSMTLWTGEEETRGGGTRRGEKE